MTAQTTIQPLPVTTPPTTSNLCLQGETYGKEHCFALTNAGGGAENRRFLISCRVTCLCGPPRLKPVLQDHDDLKAWCLIINRVLRSQCATLLISLCPEPSSRKQTNRPAKLRKTKTICKHNHHIQLFSCEVYFHKQQKFLAYVSTNTNTTHTRTHTRTLFICITRLDLFNNTDKINKILPLFESNAFDPVLYKG